jgi:acyl-coenzyme A thioesterase 1/2/4
MHSRFFSDSVTRAIIFSLNYWFKARGTLSDDQALHRFVIWSLFRYFYINVLWYKLFLQYYRCAVAYASDLLYSGVSLNPHREKGLKTYSLSLDHVYVPVTINQYL